MNLGRNLLGRGTGEGGVSEVNTAGMASKFYASVPPTAKSSAVKATSSALSSAAQNEKVQNAAASSIQSSLNEQLKSRGGFNANTSNMISGQVGRAAPMAMSKAAQNERLMNKMSEQIVDRSASAAFGVASSGGIADKSANGHQQSNPNNSSSSNVSVDELKQKLSALYGQNYTPKYIPDSTSSSPPNQHPSQLSAHTGHSTASGFTSSQPLHNSSFPSTTITTDAASRGRGGGGFADFSTTQSSNSASRQFGDPFASYNRPIGDEYDSAIQSFAQSDRFGPGSEPRDNIDCKLFSAIHDFQGQADDELTFQKGDLIIVTGNVNEEWWLGRLKHSPPSERQRMFPANFVESVKKTRSTNRPPPVAPKPMSFSNTQQKFMAGSSNSNEPYCIALYDYAPQCVGDLAFKEGDRIKILRKVDSNWIEGEFFGSKGIFPSNFVRIELDLPTSSSTIAGFQASSEKDMRRVLYSYQASTYDELSVSAGDVVQVVGTMPDCAEWLSCQLGTKRGYLPANFLS